MSVTNFKPAIWSKVILAALQKNLVFGGPGITNDDYEGEISGAGNSVKITSFSDPSINTYTQGSNITYDTLTDAGLTLPINQQDSFGFRVDDVDRRQAAGDMQQYLEERAGYLLADKADQYLAGLYTGVAAGNIIQNGVNPSTTVGDGISVTMGGTDIVTKVLQPLSVKLSEALVPKTNRYVVMPPWAVSVLSSVPAFIGAQALLGGTGADAFANGFMGRVAGFDVYESQNAVKFDNTNGGYIVQAGHPMALTFAQQISETEALRDPNQFADLVRGLHVYGALLQRPTAIAVAGVVRPAGV